jgi:hypothetical protein
VRLSLRGFFKRARAASRSGKVLVAYDFDSDIHLLDHALVGFTVREPPGGAHPGHSVARCADRNRASGGKKAKPASEFDVTLLDQLKLIREVLVGTGPYAITPATAGLRLASAWSRPALPMSASAGSLRLGRLQPRRTHSCELLASLSAPEVPIEESNDYVIGGT